MEKLLRCCEIDTIYVLVRSKRGKTTEARLAEIFADVVFDRLRQLQPKFANKIIGIAGDCLLPDLGISQDDRHRLVTTVNIVFHVAATVRFDEKIKLALGINVAGTRKIMQLVRECEHLAAMVHVSTAYANCNQSVIEEQIYRPYMSGEDAVRLAGCLDERTLDEITPQ